RWMDVHGEAIYGTDGGDVCEFITYGRQTTRGNNLYLLIRFWDGRDSLRLAGLKTRVHRATLLTTHQELEFEQDEEALTLKGLPSTSLTELFPVIRLECDGPPKAHDWAVPRLWTGDPRRFTRWAAERGTTVDAFRTPRREEA
ncbi:MAG: alpha-L-fucosidase, partial [Armatimonadetes bacterium]|nr:alpha-L-fucosidase [Armatimonadota bacterium]